MRVRAGECNIGDDENDMPPAAAAVGPMVRDRRERELETAAYVARQNGEWGRHRELQAELAAHLARSRAPPRAGAAGGARSTLEAVRSYESSVNS